MDDDDRLITILDKHAVHLRDVSLYIHSTLFPCLRGGTSFPTLHHLELGALDDFPPPEAPNETFRLAPQLKSLSLDAVSPSILTLCWEQLTTFSTSDVSLEDCLSVVRKVPCLREFELWGVDEAQATPGPPFLHPGLISLELRNPGSEGIIPLLALPKLQRLLLSHLSELPDDTLPLPLISSPSLDTFIFGFNTPMVTLAWLHVMEHLTSLELSSPLWAHKDGLCHALNRAHEPHFLPNLENFTISECETHEVNQSVLDALISRSGPAAEEGLATLKSFDLIWPTIASSPRFPINYDDFKDLRAGGLEIHIGLDRRVYVSTSTTQCTRADTRPPDPARLKRVRLVNHPPAGLQRFENCTGISCDGCVGVGVCVLQALLPLVPEFSLTSCAGRRCGDPDVEGARGARPGTPHRETPAADTLVPTHTVLTAQLADGWASRQIFPHG
ncbi:hypothetical protein C8J57DRAFT_1581802 [Mycena rebaudengoi]|nr:hypothetical protein C8J57DRAFT_1581802 [Mycena rebaudengoi]